jgi:hypothetical protein
MSATVARGGASKSQIDTFVVSQKTLFLASTTVESWQTCAVVSLLLKSETQNRAEVKHVPVLPGMSLIDTRRRVLDMALKFADAADAETLLIRHTVTPILWRFDDIAEAATSDLEAAERVWWELVASHDNEAYQALYSAITEQT